MNESDKLPYSIQYLADYDSCFGFFFLEKKGGVRPLRPHLDPPLGIIDQIFGKTKHAEESNSN